MSTRQYNIVTPTTEFFPSSSHWWLAAPVQLLKSYRSSYRKRWVQEGAGAASVLAVPLVATCSGHQWRASPGGRVERSFASFGSGLTRRPTDRLELPTSGKDRCLASICWELWNGMEGRVECRWLGRANARCEVGRPACHCNCYRRLRGLSEDMLSATVQLRMNR